MLLPPLPRAEGPAEHGTLTSGRLCTLSSDVCSVLSGVFLLPVEGKISILEKGIQQDVGPPSGKSVLFSDVVVV